MGTARCWDGVADWQRLLAAAEDLLPRAAGVLAEATGPARRSYVTPDAGAQGWP